MQKENSVTLTGVFTLEQITSSFQKQSIVFGSKDRDGNWKDGNFELYVKPDLVQQSGITAGDVIKAKGFMVFSFFTKQDGTQMSFPKLIVTEVLEVEKAGTQPGVAQAQPTQPQAMMNTGNTMQPPMPGQAPTMPPQPQQVAPQPQAAEAFPPPMPPQPMA